MTFLGIFTWYYFCICEVRLIPCEVRLKWTSENSELEKTQISFLGEGDLWWVGWGMWGEVCEVGYARWGMWGEICEVRFGWRGPLVGGVGYARWDLHEVTFTWGEIYASHLVKNFTPWYFVYLAIIVWLTVVIRIQMDLNRFWDARGSQCTFYNDRSAI